MTNQPQPPPGDTGNEEEDKTPRKGEYISHDDEPENDTGRNQKDPNNNPAMPGSKRIGADGKPSGYSGIPGGTGGNQGDPGGNSAGGQSDR
jgi:hypothetical protein